MCTSASTAWRATSAGVWKSGPTSTSNPRSANAVAITFWPRSWPSWPILATRMRGRRPWRSAKASAMWSTRAVAGDSPTSARYTPEMVRTWAAWRPYTFSRASLISPTVAWARAASTASFSRLSSRPAGRVPSLAIPAAAVSRSSAAAHGTSSRSARSRRSFSTGSARTAELSTFSTSICSSASSRYLLTPTTVWRPESMRAWVRAAASSMRSLGMPASMALVMPPAASTSSMWAHARWASS